MAFNKEKSEELQRAAFEEAFEVFQERNLRYEDLWKDEGTIDDLLHHVKHKSLRISRDAQVDDAIDLVNYSIFILRWLIEEE
jgi:hypothetical protein